MRSRHLPVIGTVALLTLLVVAAATGGPWTMNPSPRLPRLQASLAPPSPEPIASFPVAPPGPPGDNTPWLLIALLVLLAVLLAFGAVAAARRIRAWTGEERQTPVDADVLEPGLGAVGGTIDLPVLVDAVAQALSLLDDAATPTDAVVAAWVSLEDAAARHGWERHPSETSTEFTARLLDVSPAPPVHTATLRHLYQQARFTTHPVTPEQVAQARTALEAIARALEGRPA